MSHHPPRPETEVATLRMLNGCAAGRIHVLDRCITVIGRDQSCHIRIEDDGVADRHVMVHAIPGQRPLIVDPDGLGITRVNGRVVEETSLRDGDIVLLGPRTVARFEYRGVIRLEDAMPIAARLARLSAPV